MKLLAGQDSTPDPDGNWNAVEETRYLLSVPGMCESIEVGMAQPLRDLAKSLEW